MEFFIAPILGARPLEKGRRSELAEWVEHVSMSLRMITRQQLNTSYV